MRNRNNWLDGLDHWSTPVMANILWFLLTMLVITAPAAVVGLLGVMFRWATNRNPEIFSVFFRTIRRTWYKAYFAVGLDIAGGGLVLLNLLIIQAMPDNGVMVYLSRGVTLSLAILLLLINLYLWVLIAIWDAPFGRLLKLSVQLVFVEPLWTLAIAIGCGAVVFASIMLPVAVVIAVSGAVMGFVVSRGTWTVVTKYVLPSEAPIIDLY